MGRIPHNAEYTKAFNRKLVLRLLRSRKLSRADLARETGLTRAAASLIVDELLAENIVYESEASTGRRGRAPILLDIRADAFFAAGIHWNRECCRLGLSDMAGNLAACSELDPNALRDEHSLSVLADAVQALLQQGGIPREKLLGLGVSTPGPLDAREGRILNAPRFEPWQQMALAPGLQQRLQLPVYLENNASCLAIFNKNIPALHGIKDFLLLLVDSGVGSGVVLNGKLLRSDARFSSELGHVSIDFQGRACPCGNIGCLEMYAALPNLLKEWPQFSDWAQLAASDDPASCRALEQEARYLSAGIVTLANLLDIRAVLLAGDILLAFDRLQPLILENLRGRILAHNDRALDVLPAISLPGTEVRAACNIVFDRFLSSESL